MLSRVKRRMLQTPEASLPLLSALLLGLTWELLARCLDSLLLPGFVETIAALAHLVTTAELWQALWVSNQAMVLGFMLAAFVGVLLGLVMGRWRTAERYLDPYLSILLATPKSALIPIVIMATGLGLVSRVLVTFSYSVVAITINARAGLRMIDPAWTEMACSFSANEWQLWRKVLVRGALPGIVTGLRLGLARAVSGMVSVELLLVALGIGRLLLVFQGMFDAASLYATVLVLVGEAVLLGEVCRWLERRMVPWADQGALRERPA